MMKEPESGTEVFAIGTRGAGTPDFTAGFSVDMSLFKDIASSSSFTNSARLIQGFRLITDSTAVEAASSFYDFDYQSGWGDSANGADTNDQTWMFKRAKGFFDVVAYTGNGPSNHDVKHSLGVVPEMIIVKCRDVSNHWICYHSELGATKYLHLNLTSSQGTNDFAWGDTEPSATTFRVDNGVNAHGTVNANNSTYIAYLFATLPGVSKVGSYTGIGDTLDIDCGFSGGARFVLIKRTDDGGVGEVGDWGIFDTSRGINTGTDSNLVLNDDAGEVTTTDHINPYPPGFSLSGDIEFGGLGREYIFLAIA
jgi:hypothetical protein